MLLCRSEAIFKAILLLALFHCGIAYLQDPDVQDETAMSLSPRNYDYDYFKSRFIPFGLPFGGLFQNKFQRNKPEIQALQDQLALLSSQLSVLQNEVAVLERNSENITKTVVSLNETVYVPSCDAGFKNVKGTCYNLFIGSAQFDPDLCSRIPGIPIPGIQGRRYFLATPDLSADNDEFGINIVNAFGTQAIGSTFWIGYTITGVFGPVDARATVTNVNSNFVNVNIDENRWLPQIPASTAVGDAIFVILTPPGLDQNGSDWRIRSEATPDSLPASTTTPRYYLCQQ